MFSEYQLVKLKRPREGVIAGAIGAVVMAYASQPPGYEVEFVDVEGVTIGLLTLHDDDLDPASQEDLQSWRKNKAR